MRTVLVVAADPYELRWIRPGSRKVRFLKVAGGPGPRLAAKAVDQVVEPFDAILSTGVCGALDGRLKVGDVVVASSVNGQPVEAPTGPGDCFRGPLLSVDRIVGTAAEKRRMGESGAVAVEMEAAGLYERARSRAVPLYCVRAVSDTVEESFAFDLNAARRDDGRFDTGVILKLAFRRPWVGIPELFRLRRNAMRAARALGDFVANCDF